MRRQSYCASIIHTISNRLLIFVCVAHEFQWMVRERYLQKIHALDFPYDDYLHSCDKYSLHVQIQQRELLLNFAFQLILTVRVNFPRLQYVRTKSQLKY